MEVDGLTYLYHPKKGILIYDPSQDNHEPNGVYLYSLRRNRFIPFDREKARKRFMTLARYLRTTNLTDLQEAEIWGERCKAFESYQKSGSYSAQDLKSFIRCPHCSKYTQETFCEHCDELAVSEEDMREYERELKREYEEAIQRRELFQRAVEQLARAVEQLTEEDKAMMKEEKRICEEEKAMEEEIGEYEKEDEEALPRGKTYESLDFYSIDYLESLHQGGALGDAWVRVCLEYSKPPTQSTLEEEVEWGWIEGEEDPYYELLNSYNASWGSDDEEDESVYQQDEIPFDDSENTSYSLSAEGLHGDEFDWDSYDYE